MSNLQFLDILEAVIRERIASPTPQSYTARLVGGGSLKVAQKLGEESIELALAAIAEDDARVKDEAADLVYHLLLLLALRGVAFAEVVATLEKRHRERELDARP